MLLFSLLRELFHPAYYRNVLAGSRRFNPFLSLFIISLVSVISPAVTLYTQGFVLAQNFEPQVRTLVDRVVPAELEIRIKDGIASTNVQEPYYVTVSAETFKGTFLEDTERTSTYNQRLLVIDTKGDVEDFERYQSVALLTERSLVYYDDGEIQVRSLREVEDVVLNKSIIESRMNELFAKYNVGELIRGAVLILPVFILIGFYIGYWILTLFYSLLVYVMMKIVNASSSYKRAIVFTSAIMFLPYIFVILVSLIPGLPKEIRDLFDYKWLFILVCAHVYIHALQDARHKEGHA